MKYLTIKNLEKYHPKFKDRNLLWCKLYFSTLNTDPEFMLLDEIDKWRYFAFVMLELQMKKPVPLDEKFLMMKGFDFKKRNLDITLDKIRELVNIDNILISEKYQNECLDKSREDKEKDKEKDKEYMSLWNDFVGKDGKLSPIKEITPSRRKKLALRLKESSFDFGCILEAAAGQPFLMGQNDRGWVFSFDWLIENDTNYMKVLENKYKKDTIKHIQEPCKF